MAHYGNGLETKKRIFAAACRLFYEKGFEGTTFKEISTVEEVNSGLIVYYYKTKNQLASHVFQAIMMDMMARISEEFGDQDELTQYFISDFLYFRLLYEDPAFRQFIKTCCSNGALNKNQDELDPDYRRVYQSIMERFSDDYIPDMTLQEGLMAVFEAAKNSYSVYICDCWEKMTTEMAATNYITIYCRLLGIPKEEYGPRMLQAELQANMVSVSGREFSFSMWKQHHHLRAGKERAESVSNP